MLTLLRPRLFRMMRQFNNFVSKMYVMYVLTSFAKSFCFIQMYCYEGLNSSMSCIGLTRAVQLASHIQIYKAKYVHLFIFIRNITLCDTLMKCISCKSCSELKSILIESKIEFDVIILIIIIECINDNNNSIFLHFSLILIASKIISHSIVVVITYVYRK